VIFFQYEHADGSWCMQGRTRVAACPPKAAWLVCPPVSWLPREVMESPPLEVFMRRVDTALWDMV